MAVWRGSQPKIDHIAMIKRPKNRYAGTIPTQTGAE